MILMTATGTTVNVEWYGRSDIDRNLYLGAKDLTPAEAVAIFADPKQTKALTFYNDLQNMDDESTLAKLNAFTRFVQIRIDDINGLIIVALGKEEVEE